MTERNILCVPCAKNPERIKAIHLAHRKRREWWSTASQPDTECHLCHKPIKVGGACYAETIWDKSDRTPDRWEDKAVTVLTTKEGPVEVRQL